MRPTVLVTDDVMRGLREAAAAGLPNEVGDILLGGYNEDRPWVSDFVEIASMAPGPARYRIPAGATQEIIDVARQADPRLGYLGDWHSHTVNVGVSTTDRATSIRSANDPATGTENPLLVVVRQARDGWDVDYLQVCGDRHVVCQVELTGPTPPPPPSSVVGRRSVMRRRLNPRRRQA